MGELRIVEADRALEVGRLVDIECGQGLFLEPAPEHVTALVALEAVVAEAADQKIVTEATPQEVGPAVAMNFVGTTIAEEAIRTAVPVNQVGTDTTMDRIAAGPAINQIVATPAVNVVACIDCFDVRFVSDPRILSRQRITAEAEFSGRVDDGQRKGVDTSIDDLETDTPVVGLDGLHLPRQDRGCDFNVETVEKRLKTLISANIGQRNGRIVIQRDLEREGVELRQCLRRDIARDGHTRTGITVAIDRILLAASEDRVRAASTVERVKPPLAVQFVRACAAVEGVVAPAAEDLIISRITQQNIAAEENAEFRLGNLDGATTHQSDNSTIADDNIVIVTALDPVGATPAKQNVVAALSVDKVIGV